MPKWLVVAQLDAAVLRDATCFCKKTHNMVSWRLCDTDFFKRAVSDMTKFISLLMLTLVALSSPLKAQTTEQLEADELAALRYYAKVLGSLESVKNITATARGSWRPSSLFEGEAELDGSGQLLRGVSASLKKLADASDISNRPWVQRWENYNRASGFVRKVAAAINLTAEFVDAVQNAETSSAEDKLRAMSQIITDIGVLVPVSNIGVGVYVSQLARAVEGIATDAAIIEAATKRTNETIALVNKMIVGEDAAEPEENPSLTAIEEIEARIRELENRAARRLFAEAYNKITEAESACSQELNISMDDISELRRTLAAATREVRNIEAAKGANSQLVPSLNLLIEATRTGIVEARTDMENPEKVLAASRRIERLEHELTLYQTELRNAERVVKERNLIANIDLIIAQQKKEESASALAGFDECVQNHLGEPDVELNDLIGTYFPRYKNSGPNLTGKWVYNGAGRAEIIQSGNRFFMTATWTPNDKAGPHYEVNATLTEQHIEGNWHHLTAGTAPERQRAWHFEAIISSDGETITVVDRTEGGHGWSNLVLTRYND